MCSTTIFGNRIHTACFVKSGKRNGQGMESVRDVHVSTMLHPASIFKVRVFRSKFSVYSLFFAVLSSNAKPM
jgi:hypothetical protein